MRYAVAVAALLFVLSLVQDFLHGRERAQWDSDRARIIESVAQKDAQIVKLMLRADSASAVADSIAQEARARQPEIRERIRVVVDTLPPDTIRDPIIHDLLTEAEQWQAAYEWEVEAHAETRQALVLARASVDSLTALAHRVPDERSPWLPQVGIGLFTGVCSSGTVCTGAGATLSWRIRL